MGKKALIAISFGTTYENAMHSIEKIEDTLQQAMPDYDFFRAFTSRMVIKKLNETRGLAVPTPFELLEELERRGYTEIACQSLHVINGLEYDKMCRHIDAYTNRFQSVYMGAPLLSCEEDYILCAEAVIKNLSELGPTQALVLMGHGTEHFANGAYCQLENTFRYLGYENVYVGTVEGFPGLDYVLSRLKKKNISKVILLPFMVVAGDHAQNDMAGPGSNSWKSVLEQNGYQVEVKLQGLGELLEIRKLFSDHMLKAVNTTD